MVFSTCASGALARASSVVAALLVGPAAEAAARGDGAPLKRWSPRRCARLTSRAPAAAPPCATAVRDEAGTRAGDAHVSC